MRIRHGDGNQLTSLQEELARLRAELKESHDQNQRQEAEHGSEKLVLTQVSRDLGSGALRGPAGFFFFSFGYRDNGLKMNPLDCSGPGFHGRV